MSTPRENDLTAVLRALAWYAHEDCHTGGFAVDGYRAAYQRAVQLVGEPTAERPALPPITPVAIAQPGTPAPACADKLADAVRALRGYTGSGSDEQVRLLNAASEALAEYDAAKEGAAHGP